MILALFQKDQNIAKTTESYLDLFENQIKYLKKKKIMVSWAYSQA